MTDKKKDAQTLTEEVGKLFEGSDVTDEMQEKIATILEAVISTKVSERQTQLDEENETKWEEALTEYTSQLEETVNRYLEYVVGQWLEENKLAVESGVRVEIAENFMNGMKEIFEANQVTVPEGKEDVLVATQNQVENLEANLHESIEKVATLAEMVETFERKKAVEPHYAGLTDTQKEKLDSLVEDVQYKDSKGFSKKVGIIKESFLKGDSNEDDNGSKDKNTAGDEESPMNKYMSALKQSNV